MLDSFELNKILGAILGTCLALLTLNIVANAIFAPVKPAKPGFEIAVATSADPAQGAAKGAPAQAEVPLEQLLASADVGRGAESAKKCVACHTLEQGGKTLSGPPLWGLVGRAKAGVPGFNYSPAMKSQTGNWTIADLYKFVTNPKAMVPGTSMAFAGITRAGERADLMAYLNSRADNPAPLNRAAQAPAGATAR